MTRIYADIVGDLFHVGHVEFLRRARELGDELVVGVHTDEDCEWFRRRPVLTLDERVQLVAACRYVDRVIAGAPVRTTETWLRAQGIDVVVHGDDMPERALRYWYAAPIALGIFRVLPHTPDISSDHIEGRIRARNRNDPSSPGIRLAKLAFRAVARMPAVGPLVQFGISLDRVKALDVVSQMPAVGHPVQRRLFVANLRRLHDALRGTPIDGRYWVWGGLLIGWAREGRPLAHDLHDVDFAYLDEDHDRFLDSVRALTTAGFGPYRRFSSADGRYVEHVFRRDGVRFEFFRLARRADRWRYSVFTGHPAVPSELIAEIPAQPRVPFVFLGRQWLKVADHDLELRSIYGDWRTPRTDWIYTEDHAVVERVALAGFPLEWRWPEGAAHGPGDRPREGRDGAPSATARSEFTPGGADPRWHHPAGCGQGNLPAPRGEP